MSDRKIVLRVREEIECPLFRSGDQMVLTLPSVDRAASTDICALAIAKFIEEKRAWECGSSLQLMPGQFLCPRSVNPVVFEVMELDEKSDAAPMIGNLTNDLGQAVAALRTVPVFRALPASVLGRLAQEIRIETFSQGQVVVEKGTLGRAFYIVHSGALEVVDYADQEVSSVITRLKPRDCFGEMSLLTGALSAATVVSVAPVTLLSLPKEAFDRLLRENAYLASAFTRLLAGRLMSTNVLLVKEGAKPFSGKLQEMSLPTVLQVLADSNRSGTLIVDDYRGSKMRIGFSSGRIFEAELGDLRGESAVYEALRWQKGDFWLDKKQVPHTDTIDISVMGLLLEGMRRIDEGLPSQTQSQTATADESIDLDTLG
jgi:CRP-like cAMP-binding protein